MQYKSFLVLVKYLVKSESANYEHKLSVFNKCFCRQGDNIDIFYTRDWIERDETDYYS